jgi:HD-like signal output (HDOD) protein
MAPPNNEGSTNDIKVANQMPIHTVDPKYIEKKYYPNTFFTMTLIETLQQTQEFASLPTVAAKLLSMLEDDSTDVRTIARHVEQDVSIATKVVRVANSPMFGLRVPVSSIAQAIMTIGLSRVTNIVLGVSIYSKFIFLQTLAGNYLHQFWMHSAVTATLSRALAKLLRQDFQELEFLAGLVHDIGKLAMLQHDAQRFEQVRAAISEGANELEAERMFFDATHAEAGEVVANLWKLPPHVQLIIKLHHENDLLDDQFASLLAVVRVADLLAERYGFSSGEVLGEEITDTNHWNRLVQLSKRDLSFSEVEESIEQELASAQSLLQALTSE